MRFHGFSRRLPVLFLSLGVVVLSGVSRFAGGVCGPFTDVSDVNFCPFVLEVFYVAITTGTTATTYDPTSAVTRLQMAAFLSRTVDRTLQCGSRRAALNQFWKTETNAGFALTTVGNSPQFPSSDGEDVWVGSNSFWS